MQPVVQQEIPVRSREVFRTQSYLRKEHRRIVAIMVTIMVMRMGIMVMAMDRIMVIIMEVLMGITTAIIMVPEIFSNDKKAYRLIGLVRFFLF